MSVINDMLRDLNQRRAPEVADGRASVPQSLIEPQKNILRTLLVVLIFVLCVAAATAYWFTSLKDSMSVAGEQVSQRDDGLSFAQESPVSQEQALLRTPLSTDNPQQEALSVSVEVSSTAPQDGASVSNEPQLKSAASPTPHNVAVATVSPTVNNEPEITVRPLASRTQEEMQTEAVVDKPVQAEIKALPASALHQTKTADKLQPGSESQSRPVSKVDPVSRAVPVSQVEHASKDASVTMQVGLSPAAKDRQMAERSLKQFASGNGDQAYRDLVEFLETHEIDDESRAVLANYLLQENRLAEAGDLLLNAPIQSSTSLRQLKARWYAAQGDDKMALYTLNSELPEIRQYPDYYVLLAAYYQRFGWHKEALKTYTALVEYDDSVADWWAGLALAADRTQDFKQAALAYEQALELPGLTPELSNFIKNRLKQLRAVQRNS